MLIDTAKEIAKVSAEFSKKAREISHQCPDKRMKHVSLYCESVNKGDQDFVFKMLRNVSIRLGLFLVFNKHIEMKLFSHSFCGW